MSNICHSESQYECLCGYSFIQTDGQGFRKLKLIRRLHAKKCELGKEINKMITPSFDTTEIKKERMAKEDLKKEIEFFNTPILQKALEK